MEIHVIYKLDNGETIPGTLTLKPKDVAKLKKLYPSLRAISLTTVKELTTGIPKKSFKNRLTK